MFRWLKSPEERFVEDYRHAHPDEHLKLTRRAAPISVQIGRSHFYRRGGGEEEFRRLQLMHKVFGSLVVRPHELVYHQGNLIGYSMQRISGLSLEDLSNGGAIAADWEKKNIFKSLNTFLGLIISHRMPHGDLLGRNIMWSSCDRRVTIIDPVGLTKQDPEYVVDHFLSTDHRNVTEVIPNMAFFRRA